MEEKNFFGPSNKINMGKNSEKGREKGGEIERRAKSLVSNWIP